MGATYEVDWGDHAACKGHGDLFFRPPGVDPNTATDRWRVKLAKAICATCPVQRECAACARRNGETHGIWAGVDFDMQYQTGHAKRRSRRADLDHRRDVGAVPADGDRPARPGAQLRH